MSKHFHFYPFKAEGTETTNYVKKQCFTIWIDLYWCFSTFLTDQPGISTLCKMFSPSSKPQSPFSEQNLTEVKLLFIWQLILHSSIVYRLFRKKINMVQFLFLSRLLFPSFSECSVIIYIIRIILRHGNRKNMTWQDYDDS